MCLHISAWDAERLENGDVDPTPEIDRALDRLVEHSELLNKMRQAQ